MDSRTKSQPTATPRRRARARPAPDEAAVRTALMALLDRRGASGATRRQLLRGAHSAARQAALKALILERSVRSAPVKCVERFLLPRHALPVESVYDILDEQLPRQRGPLLISKDFDAALRTAGARVNLPAALDALVKERRLLPLERSGVRFYLHLPSIQGRLEPAPESVAPDLEVDESAVESAWRKIRAYSGFDDAAISDLQQAAGVSHERFSQWLAAEARAGRWLLSTGDPLHATDAQRAAAISVNGATYLFARRVS